MDKDINMLAGSVVINVSNVEPIHRGWYHPFSLKNISRDVNAEVCIDRSAPDVVRQGEIPQGYTVCITIAE